jgi:5-(aminomethyl)-3-furanmethanol phosphate kinase
MSCIVVKLGGSLFDLPDLADRLRRFLRTLDTDHLVLLPGGGAAADAVRMLDRVHRLGEEAAHWLALDAMSLNARFLQRLLPDAALIAKPGAQGFGILDAAPFFRADDHLPHSWDVTGDSLAARAAIMLGARELVLLKSVAWQGNDWEAASAARVVDRYFRDALRAARGMHVRIVNLRESC